MRRAIIPRESRNVRGESNTRLSCLLILWQQQFTGLEAKYPQEEPSSGIILSWR